MEQPTCLHTTHRHPKFPTDSYYIDGSYTPPNLDEPYKPSDIARYGIYNKEKNIKISTRLPRLQNIVQVKLIAIHNTLKLISPNLEPTYIFTYNLNSIYLINIQLKHQTSQNNHPNKLLLQEITNYTKSKISTLHIRKVKVCINILGNKQADKLAKKRCSKRNHPHHRIIPKHPS